MVVEPCVQTTVGLPASNNRNAMIPIHELLSRIRWDKSFGQGQFELGYYDRVEGVIHQVKLQAVTFPQDERHTFEIVDESGQVRRIPFHRVREVVKDGQVIWQRPSGESPAA
jgi:uncharacterized protein (UPF0248 family)